MIDWRHWHNEPFLIGGIILVCWLYTLAIGPLRPRLAPGEPYPRRQALSFYAGCVIFYLAVGSPLDQIGERFLLSAHMVQHQMLIYGAAVLFIVGLPVWLLERTLDKFRPRIVLKVLFHPICAAVGYSVILSVWHAPALYDLALRDKTVHIIEHLMFFGAAVWYWWPLLSPSRVYPTVSNPAQMIYLVAVTILMTPVFAFIAFSDNVLYPTYEYAPRLVGSLDPMGDQLLGAAIMKLGGLAVTFIALVVVFYRWYQRSERGHGAPRTGAVRPM